MTNKIKCIGGYTITIDRAREMVRLMNTLTTDNSSQNIPAILQYASDITEFFSGIAGLNTVPTDWLHDWPELSFSDCDGSTVAATMQSIEMDVRNALSEYNLTYNMNYTIMDLDWNLVDPKTRTYRLLVQLNPPAQRVVYVGFSEGSITPKSPNPPGVSGGS